MKTKIAWKQGWIAALLALLVILAACSDDESASDRVAAKGLGISVTSIALTPSGTSTQAGFTVSITATATFDDASTGDVTGLVSWSSGAPAVASVSSGGVVTGLTTGSSTITATDSKSGVSNSVTISVAGLNSIVITPRSNAVPLGAATVFLTATGNYSDASTADLTSMVSWNSSNTGVVTVAAGGGADDVGYGMSNIAATLSVLGVSSAPAQFRVTETTALHNDPGCYDYIPGNFGSETSNAEASLNFMGYPVQPFGGMTGAIFNPVLTGKFSLMIVEPFCNLSVTLDPPAIAAVQNFVGSGGTVVFFSTGSMASINGIFGFGVGPGSSSISTLTAGAAADPRFAGAPASLSTPSATSALGAGALPGGSFIIYESFTGDAVVAEMPYGAGRVVFMGWDWFDAWPVGISDGGWLNVLIRVTP